MAVDKRARVRDCLLRAGLGRLPPSDSDDLGPYGFDSLVSVLAVIELEKEFRVSIPSQALASHAFDTIEELASLVPG